MARILIVFVLVVVVGGPGRAFAQDGQPIATVTAQQLNVRSGPGVQFEIIGALKRGGRFVVSGVSADRAWVFFKFWDRDGWVSAQHVSGVDLNAIPIAGETPPKPAQNSAILKAGTYTISPATPEPNKPFSVALQILNVGDLDAGVFSVAVVWPGGHFEMVTVPSLARDSAAMVTLNSPGQTATGRHTVTVIIDVEDQVAEPAEAEKSHMVNVNYGVDRALVAQGEIEIKPQVNVDLHGGEVDLAWDGATLSTLGDAGIERLGMKMSDVHYDALGSLTGQAVIPAVGDVLGVYLAEARRAVVRVVSIEAGKITLQYLIYAM